MTYHSMQSTNAERDARDVHAVIQAMHRAELGAVILGAGYALPTGPDGRIATVTREALRDAVRALYQDGTITGADILAEYKGA
jgi:hypothetical protein